MKQLEIMPNFKNYTYKDFVDRTSSSPAARPPCGTSWSRRVKNLRVGNLMVLQHIGSMPHELTKESIVLFCTEVLPKLRDIWDDEGWENHWWPKSLRNQRPWPQTDDARGRSRCHTDEIRDVEVWDGQVRTQVIVGGEGPPLLYLHADPRPAVGPVPRLPRPAPHGLRAVPAGHGPGRPGRPQGDRGRLGPDPVYDEILDALGLDARSRRRPLLRRNARRRAGRHAPRAGVEARPALPDRAVDRRPRFRTNPSHSASRNWPRRLRRPHRPGRHAALTMPEDPEALGEALIAINWTMGVAGKFWWPIPDRGLPSGSTGSRADPRDLGREGRDHLAPYAADFARLIPSARAEVLPTPPTSRIWSATTSSARWWSSGFLSTCRACRRVAAPPGHPDGCLPRRSRADARGRPPQVGSTFCVRLPLFGRCVVLTDPVLIKELFTTPSTVAGDMEPNLGRVLGVGSLFNLDHEPHRRRRKVLAPPLHGRRMKTYEDIVVEETRREVASWPHGEEFATAPGFMRITLNVILRAVFGAEGPECDRFRDLLPGMVERGSRLMLLPIPKTGGGPFNPWHSFLKDRQEYDSIIASLTRAPRRIRAWRSGSMCWPCWSAAVTRTAARWTAGTSPMSCSPCWPPDTRPPRTAWPSPWNG